MIKQEAFKKYLHMYVGSEARITYDTGRSIINDDITIGVLAVFPEYIEQLHLRSYSTMTPEEALEFARLKYESAYGAVCKEGGIVVWYQYVGGNDYILFDQLNPAQFLWLLKRGFDVFGLIPKGYAKELQQ